MISLEMISLENEAVVASDPRVLEKKPYQQLVDTCAA